MSGTSIIAQFSMPLSKNGDIYSNNIFKQNLFRSSVISTSVRSLLNIWASAGENLFSGVCQQHRRRPVCASAQTDQRLCLSLYVKYHM